MTTADIEIISLCFEDIERSINRTKSLCAEQYAKSSKNRAQQDKEQKVDFARVKARWESADTYTTYKCSNCGEEPMYTAHKKTLCYVALSKFCPYCGAEMDRTECEYEEEENVIDIEEYDAQDCESCKYFNGDDNECRACGKSFIVGIHREQNRKQICPLKKYRSRING